MPCGMATHMPAPRGAARRSAAWHGGAVLTGWCTACASPRIPSCRTWSAPTTTPRRAPLQGAGRGRRLAVTASVESVPNCWMFPQEVWRPCNYDRAPQVHAHMYACWQKSVAGSAPLAHLLDMHAANPCMYGCCAHMLPPPPPPTTNATQGKATQAVLPTHMPGWRTCRWHRSRWAATWTPPP